MKKISRRQLRKIILNEMGSMGNLDDLTTVSIPGETDLPYMIAFRSAVKNAPNKVKELCDLLNEKIKDLPAHNEPLDERRGREIQYMVEEIDKLISRIK